MNKEITVLSGKGGTGKTTLVASMLAYLDKVVVADCDVDAPDLHILLNGKNEGCTPFSGLKRAVKNKDLCIECGKCQSFCKFGAIDKLNHIDSTRCEGCGVCAYVCHSQGIEMIDSVIGHIYQREINKGAFVYGRLIPGEETSGKLVSAVRKQAKIIGQNKEFDTLIIDGAPGIACNVIASVTGVKHVIIVTEPTLSGLHDLKRVYELVSRFHVGISVVINKADLSLEGRAHIRRFCEEEGLTIGLEIPFNKAIVHAISQLELPPIALRDFYENIGFKRFLQDLNLL